MRAFQWYFAEQVAQGDAVTVTIAEAARSPPPLTLETVSLAVPTDRPRTSPDESTVITCLSDDVQMVR